MMLSSLRQRTSAVVGTALRQQQQVAGATVGSTRVVSDYIARQNKTGRPVSPHVTAYRFPVVAISSITNRVTGVGLTAGVYGIGALSLIPGLDVAEGVAWLGQTQIAPLAKMVVVFPLAYHYLAAARHTFWDFKPDAVYNESVEKSSYALFAGAGAITVAAAVL